MGKSRQRRRDAAWNPPKSGGDVTALFAVLVAVPLLLPLVTRFSFVLFVIPLVTTGVAAPRCFAAARRTKPAFTWYSVGTSAALAALASGLAAVAALAPWLAKPAFYLGAGASAALLAGVLAFAGRGVLRAAMDRIADALLFDAVVVAIGVWFVVLPGFRYHDPLLTLVFLVDLGALSLASVATLASAGSARRSGWWLVAVCAAACVGDGFVVLTDARGSSAITALCWALAGIAIALAARAAATRDGSGAESASGVGIRILMPLAAALAFPTIAFVLWTADRLDAGAATFFSVFFLATLMLAFGRQAYLLVENHRVATRERRLRSEVVRRNEELEALTALATTMTETLEEDPVIERGLAALQIAARASSMALHTRGAGKLEMRASAGEWGAEGPWAMRGRAEDWRPGVEERGGRQVVRLELAARGDEIGLITAVRGADDPFTQHELDLLGLLADQVAIAVQNARDYFSRLEQAIRDPLTSLYNRRYFFEAFETEVARCERYGSQASLVLFDVDDFKRVNDTLGHLAGDQVLCAIGRIAHSIVRPADSFARVGGEEFALLLPEASQLDALLVAERLRRAVAAAPILDGRRVTVSAGISSCPDDGATIEELESKADGALYWAKRNGKNLCAVASEVVVLDTDEQEGMLAHLHALVSAIDAEHLNTRDHSENVAAYAVGIGQALGLSRERMVGLRRAALFHDIGKIAIRSDILVKPAALTDAEMEEMKLHPTVGAAMLRHSGFAAEAEWVRAHHERVDGRGYPQGLSHDAIPLEARIIFVADSFEAMTSDRPYRPGIPIADAVVELRRCAGTQFDERIVEALCGLLEKGELAVLALRSDYAPFDLS